MLELNVAYLIDIQKASVASETEYTLILTYPSAHLEIYRRLMNLAERLLKEKPIVKRFILEKKFFLTASIHNYKWEMRVMNVQNCSETKLEFSSMDGPSYQRTFHITEITWKNSIYYLQICHKAVQAVVVARATNDVEYLILIRISLDKYKDQSSKYSDIYSLHAIPYAREGSILDYYCAIANIERSKAIYLYISPKELLRKTGKVGDVFEIEQNETRRGNPPKVEHLVGLLEYDCDIAEYLRGIEEN